MVKNSRTPMTVKPSSTKTSKNASIVRAGKSSILKSAFAPTSLQLHLFASVIQSFESQQLRIHDTTTSRLRQQHATKSGVEISCLDWGRYGPSYRESQLLNSKKRKRNQGSSEDVVLAYGTSDSEVCMYSPAEDRIVGRLLGGHEKGIKDFKFNTNDYLEGWSIGGDARLVQWDLRTDSVLRTVPLSDASTGILAQPSSVQPAIICASSTPSCINFSTSDAFELSTFDSFQSPVQTIFRSGQSLEGASELFLAADHNRYANVFDISHKKLIRTLVANSEVESADLYIPSQAGTTFQQQLLAVVTHAGVVELFQDPFSQPQAINGDLKSVRKNMTRKSAAQLKMLRSTTTDVVQICQVSIQGPDIVLVSVDGGIEPLFQKVRWQDEGTGDLLFQGVKEISKAKVASALNSAVMNGVKNMGQSHVDESRTVVVNGTNDLASQADAIEILSSDEHENEDDDDDMEEIMSEGAAVEESDEIMNDAQDQGQDDDTESDSDAANKQLQTEDGEPSFGDMLASKHPETISIGGSLLNSKEEEERISQQLAVPSGMSLGTVLTQALRTNDKSLLESCLHANDPGIIQNTIQRLDSRLAAILLSKLAERLASRPGRYGHLISWVQWTCIAHGGAIAGQPDVTAKVHTLYKVLNHRSSSLDKLLLLKGKLDMLEAQLEFRRQLEAQRGQLRDDEEGGMIYIEGDVDNWSSEDDHDEAAGRPKQLGFKTRHPLKKGLANLVQNDSESEEEEGDEMPTTNGVGSDDSEEDNDEETDSEIDASGRRRKQGLVEFEADVSGEAESLSTDSNDDDDDEEENSEEDDNGDDDEEEDSSMADFINDGEISEVSENDGLDIDDDDDDADDTPKRPATKRSKHQH